VRRARGLHGKIKVKIGLSQIYGQLGVPASMGNLLAFYSCSLGPGDALEHLARFHHWVLRCCGLDGGVIGQLAFQSVGGFGRRKA
jgi:hypothetical protein